MDENIVVVQAKCIHCNQDVIGPKASFDEIWNNHLDNCEGFKSFMRVVKELKEKNLLQLVMKQVGVEKIEKSLKRIIKKYKASPEELIEILEEFSP